MANMAPLGSSPPLSSDHQLLNASGQGAPTVLLLSVMLRAALYIRQDGELRVNATPCGQNYPRTNGFLRHCSIVDSQRTVCSYTSHDGKYLLAMDNRTGMLTSVLAYLKDQAPRHGLCVHFGEETTDTDVSREKAAFQLTGCLDSEKARPVLLSGTPVERMDICRTGVEPFVQVGDRKSDFFN